MQTPTRLEMAPGETIELVMPGLGAAGYLWQASVEGEQGVVEATAHRTAAGADHAVGAGLPEVVQVTALGCGTAVVHMTQRRPWERDGPPRAQHHTHVVVVERSAPSSTEEPTPDGIVPGHPWEPPTGVDAGAGPEDTASWVAPPVDP